LLDKHIATFGYKIVGKRWKILECSIEIVKVGKLNILLGLNPNAMGETHSGILGCVCSILTGEAEKSTSHRKSSPSGAAF
jgi:hypothetical protein